MSKNYVALPVSFLLLAFSVPSKGQTSEDQRHTPAAPTSMQSPADSSANVVRPALVDEQAADLYMLHKDFYQAAQTYKQLVDREPRNAVYLNKLGIALHQQSALPLALKYYERATKANPQYADAMNNIGTIWYQRKKYGKAIRAYRRALLVRTDMPVLYSNLGYAYFGDKKYDQALESFRQALVLDPQFFDRVGGRNGSILQDRSVSDRGRFYFMLAKSFAQAGNLTRCVLYLRKAKEEGYKELAAAKSDPAFAAVLADPAIQDILAPKPVTEQP